MSLEKHFASFFNTDWRVATKGNYQVSTDGHRDTIYKE